MKPWDNIVLTDEEREAAIIEGKKRKYFHEKNKEYWEAQEKPKYVRETKIKVGKLIIDKKLPKIFPE
jgi:hypothetical protein